MNTAKRLLVIAPTHPRCSVTIEMLGEEALQHHLSSPTTEVIRMDGFADGLSDEEVEAAFGTPRRLLDDLQVVFESRENVRILYPACLDSYEKKRDEAQQSRAFSVVAPLVNIFEREQFQFL